MTVTVKSGSIDQNGSNFWMNEAQNFHDPRHFRISVRAIKIATLFCDLGNIVFKAFFRRILRIVCHKCVINNHAQDVTQNISWNVNKTRHRDLHAG